ncbi:E3 ubiquitin-protein ligase ORTHRUS 1-like protein [Carex littledalei]|uniref:RING-type E3 ubiquitin transferase n=1 Tax=Carex littledalei TaxID=544730 RepID=A0A833QWC6_9POAL|nr:E3 ubiquitin-protein ligase ORTHRUS 1-like protein [Carex littledalei]
MAKESVLSPGFRSAAAMAGWDEEALLHASLVVDDTPVRESRHKRRINPNFKTPPSSNTSRKRRPRKRASVSIPALDLSLDDDNSEKKDNKEKIKELVKEAPNEEKKVQERDSFEESLPSKLLCMDRLREELSCAICLEICYEPSTTSCGHSFCIKCIKNSTAKCGRRCPKCRELISNGRSCTINTVLWNTIQLLFPEEVETRKQSPSETTAAINSSRNNNNPRSFVVASQLVDNVAVRRRGGPHRISQSEDATLANRLQTEEYMLAFGGPPGQQRSTIHAARANLRAMVSRASRAVHIRYRNRPM